MKNLDFTDLIDIHSLQLIQDSFAQYTGLALTVVDTESKPVTACSGDFQAGKNDSEVPIVFDGKTVGAIVVQRAAGMSEGELLKNTQFLAEFSKALSLLAYSNYKKIRKSRKVEKAARSQASYVVRLTEEMRSDMEDWIHFFQETTDKYKDMPEVRRETDLILAKGQAVYSVIDSVIDYIHLSEGNVEYSESVYDVKRLMEDIKDSVHQEAEEAGVAVRISYDPLLPKTLMGNSGRIGQAVSKLLGDLFKLTERDGIIELSVSCDKSPYACMLHIKILCTGCRMDEKTEKMIRKTIKKNVSDAYMEDNEKNDMQLLLITFLVNQMYGNMSFEKRSDHEIVFLFEVPQLDGEKAGV